MSKQSPKPRFPSVGDAVRMTAKHPHAGLTGRVTGFEWHPQISRHQGRLPVVEGYWGFRWLIACADEWEYREEQG